MGHFRRPDVEQVEDARLMWMALLRKRQARLRAFARERGRG
jgi:hypothetical protein